MNSKPPPSDAGKVEPFEQGCATLRELTASSDLFGAAPGKRAGGSDELLGQVMPLVIDLRAEARARTRTSPSPTRSATASARWASRSKTAPAAPSGPAAEPTRSTGS